MGVDQFLFEPLEGVDQGRGGGAFALQCDHRVRRPGGVQEGSFCCGHPAEVLRGRVTSHQRQFGAVAAVLFAAAQLLWRVDARHLWVVSQDDAGEQGVVCSPPRDVHTLHEGHVGQTPEGPYNKDLLT